MFGTYSAVGSILARLRQTFVTISFTIYTKEASRTGTSVPIDYVLHVNEQYSVNVAHSQVLPHFCTASDRKLGRAWERG